MSNKLSSLTVLMVSDQLVSLYEEFRSKGAIISVEPLIYADGGPWKEFVIEDPDGYHFAFGGMDGTPGG
ncbi:hypothetical protein [Bacillus sp. FJAT-26390]|uniref:hypothetical protein n=1 Tax=Bacillus sp. FJAT-26390 TaxID=1743142 RepID=UPI000807E2DC|nr:hypothetical protein [Bacillus sp. FJAT-26390]OBZ13769.1 hypothetical protein A7975_13250 [Bacillus sp. FJAT-26390]